MFNEDEFRNKVKELPSLSPVIVDVLNFLNSNEVIDYSKLEKKIIADPGLMGRILGLANSPFFGMRGEISSIKDACLVLGLNSIRNLVISSAMMQKFPTDNNGNLDFKNLWKHSIGVAAAAKILAKHVSINPEQAFIAGLLHEIGKMTLDVYFSEEYQNVLIYQNDNDCTLFEAEEKCLGINHAMAGAMIAEHWNLPENIIRAIRLHHAEEYQNPANIEHVIQLADIVICALDIGNSGDSFVPSLSPDLLEVLNIKLDDVANSLPEIEALTDNLTSLIE